EELGHLRACRPDPRVDQDRPVGGSNEKAPVTRPPVLAGDRIRILARDVRPILLGDVQKRLNERPRAVANVVGERDHLDASDMDRLPWHYGAGIHSRRPASSTARPNGSGKCAGARIASPPLSPMMVRREFVAAAR